MLNLTNENLYGDFNDAISELSEYKNIEKLIDKNKLQKIVSSKYQQNKFYELTDLYTVLIQASKGFGPGQVNWGGATPDGALKNIDRIIGSYNFSKSHLHGFSTKFLNLGTSQFWDTLTELLYFESVEKSLAAQGCKVEFEYPFGTPNQSGTSRDADLAIVDQTGNVILLIDAITPKPIDVSNKIISSINPISNPTSQIVNVLDFLTETVVKKYNSKFLNYCSSTSNPSVGVIVSVLKGEEIIATDFPDVFLSGKPRSVQEPKLLALKGLKYSSVCTFRNKINSADLGLFQIVDFGF